MTTLDHHAAADLLADVSLNLIRRGADGSLALSMDHWQLAVFDDDALTFAPEPPAPPETEPLVIPRSEIASISWDRLAKQQARSQVRFRLTNGNLLTFSGRLPDPANS